jgi:hypothetical protein
MAGWFKNPLDFADTLLDQVDKRVSSVVGATSEKNPKFTQDAKNAAGATNPTALQRPERAPRSAPCAGQCPRGVSLPHLRVQCHSRAPGMNIKALLASYPTLRALIPLQAGHLQHEFAAAV